MSNREATACRNKVSPVESFRLTERTGNCALYGEKERGHDERKQQGEREVEAKRTEHDGGNIYVFDHILLIRTILFSHNCTRWKKKTQETRISNKYVTRKVVK